MDNTEEKLLEELIEQQRNRLRKCAQEFIPNITDDDLLQPNDYPELENHPYFRYEEGVLEGLMTAHTALKAKRSEKI
jgi:hypothetical protein